MIKIKNCKICNVEFTPKTTTAKVCSMQCAIFFARIKKENQQKKIDAQKKREYRSNDKSIQKLAAQKAFNAYIRERDKNEGCISCNKTKDWLGQWHAGHYKSVGSRPDLRFNELNCHKQCSVCNNYLSGNLASYRKKLLEKIGIEEVEKLETDQNEVKYTAKDLQEITKHYKQRLKNAQKN